MDQHRVLIVEDDPLISSHLETIVAQTIASEVVISSSVADALQALRMTIDFALLDVDVADGTTYAFAGTLSSASIPFAFVSASNPQHVPHGLRSAPFVAKPYTDEEIVGLLRAAKAAA